MKKLAAIIIQAFIWVLGYVLVMEYVNTILDFRKGEGPFWLSVLFGTLINLVICYGTAFGLAPQFLDKRNWIGLVVALLVGILGINTFETLVDYFYLVGHFSTEKESFLSYFFFNLSINFFMLLVGLSYALIRYWIQNEKLKRVLLEDKLSTEMAFLKSQINPHFLFNVLNSIYAKSLKYDAPDLSDSIAKLSHLMRYMVYETTANRVKLSQEIKHLENFIKVYQLRIAEDDEVTIQFSVKGRIEEVEIAPMLMLPLVENALKHGIDPKERSEITLDLEVVENQLNFRVCNTIHQPVLGMPKKDSGFGLDNLVKRLPILYPKAHQFVTRQENGYFFAELHLNLN